MLRARLSSELWNTFLGTKPTTCWDIKWKGHQRPTSCVSLKTFRWATFHRPVSEFESEVNTEQYTFRRPYLIMTTILLDR